MSSFNFNLSSEVAAKLNNNTALKAGVNKLAEEVQQLFATRLEQLIAGMDAKATASAVSTSSSTGTASTDTGTASKAAATSTTPNSTDNNALALASTSSFLAAGQTNAAPAATGTAATGKWQAPWMVGSADAKKYLHSSYAESEAQFDNKPNLKQFMDATGSDFNTASNLLYGVVGSNKEMRNWDAIMKSADPLTAARQATGAMYSANNPAIEARPEHQLNPLGVKARTENLAWEKDGQYERLFLTDSAGNKLTQVPLTAPGILEKMRDFGFDPAQLNGLADQLDSAGVKYKPYQVYAGSDAGVDLRAIANGNARGSMAYDWTVDKNVALKGPGAADALLRNIELAKSLGS